MGFSQCAVCWSWPARGGEAEARPDSGALDTVWLQPVTPDTDYMTTLQSCFREVLVELI